MTIDWSQQVTAEQQRAAVDGVTEDKWRLSELVVIADQLMAIEDGDPSALPGTETQWRDYRTAVRHWTTGTPGFPDAAQRPQRPV